MPKRLSQKGVLLLFLGALLFRLALFWGILSRNPGGFIQSDGHEYWQIAGNIIQYRTFSSRPAPPLTPDFDRTPVTPLFLAALRLSGLKIPGIVLVQILVGTLSCLLTAFLTFKMTERGDAALFAGSLVVLDIPSVSMANLLFSETLFTLLLLGSAGAFITSLREGNPSYVLPASGVLLGLAILCRPIALFLPLFWAALLLVVRRERGALRMRKVFLFLLACFVTILPWMLRNHSHSGYLILSTIGYKDLYGYRAAAIRAEAEGISLSEARTRLFEEAEGSFPGDRKAQPVQFARFTGRLALPVIGKNPWIAVENHAKSVLSLWFRPLRNTLDLQLRFCTQRNSLEKWGVGENRSLLSRLLQQTSRFTLVLVALQLLLLAVLWIAVLVGLGAWIRKRKRLPFLLVLFTAIYFSLLSGGPQAYARFRVPLVPFLSMAGGMGLAVIFAHLFRKGVPASGTEEIEP